MVRFTTGGLLALKEEAEARVRKLVGVPVVPSSSQLGRLAGEARKEVQSLLEGLRGIREEIVREADVALGSVYRLHAIREDAAILLGEAMAEYVFEWIRHAAALNTAKGVLTNPLLGHDERKPWIEKKHAALNFFGQQFDELPKRFRPFLAVA